MHSFDSKKYGKLIEKSETPAPPADLAQKTLLAIVLRQRKILMGKLIGLGLVFAASLAMVVTQLVTATSQLGQSGFWTFGSLFFSDFGVAITNLPDMVMSLFESFPILSVGLAIGGLAIAIWSFAGFIDDANVLRASRSLLLE